MKLYELTRNFIDLFDSFDAIAEWEPNTVDGDFVDDDGNVIADVKAHKDDMLTSWFDTLQGIEEEFEIKAENVAVYIKSLIAESKELKAEKNRLDNRIKSKDRQIERLTDYLFCSMQSIGREKIDMPKALIRIKTNPESTIIDDEKSFVEWAIANNNELLKYTMPEPKKAVIKQLLKNGEKIPFARLERKMKIEIK